jgi:hypothetical protein
MPAFVLEKDRDFFPGPKEWIFLQKDARIRQR